MKFFIIFSVGIVAMASHATAAEPGDHLITALIQVESRGNDNVVGDKHLKDKAYGSLQIRKPCVQDVNKRYGTNYRAEDCLGNRELSIKIWNGGPKGFKKKSTQAYWEKVRRARGI